MSARGLLSRLFLPPSPAQALRAAAAGDARAIGELFDSHVDTLYAFVFYRLGRDAALAEDAVQETFSLALKRAADFDPSRGSLGAWLTMLSRNVVRDLRQQHRRSEQLAATWERIDESLGQIYAAMAEQPLPGEVLERAETRDLVQMAIANLPETYRTVLSRKYVDGISLVVLADELSLSSDATKSLLARARRAFREAFATLATAMELS